MGVDAGNLSRYTPPEKLNYLNMFPKKGTIFNKRKGKSLPTTNFLNGHVSFLGGVYHIISDVHQSDSSQNDPT